MTDDASPTDITRLRAQIMGVARRLRRETPGDDQSWARMLLLGAIDGFGGAATPSMLADAEAMQSSNLATALRDLEARDLIGRTPDPDDRRKTRVHLTAAGHSLLYDGRASRERWLTEAMQANLTAEERMRLVDAGTLLGRLLAYRRVGP